MSACHNLDKAKKKKKGRNIPHSRKWSLSAAQVIANFEALHSIKWLWQNQASNTIQPGIQLKWKDS